MSFQGQIGGLVPPAVPGPSASPRDASTSALPPPLPPRPNRGVVPASSDPDEGSLSDSDDEPLIPEGLDASESTVSLATPKDEEELSEVQLRELYDDEEIDRFLHLFSTYVREVRAPSSSSPSTVAHAASASAPALSETLSSPTRDKTPGGAPASGTQERARSLSERIAIEYFVPLLPPPRPPPAEFSLSRLRDTAQRLYVAVEPLYSFFITPLIRLATWQDPRQSFIYCALYWVLWYHGLLLSGLALRVLYQLLRRKLHPYPSLKELRAYRKRIDRSHTFGAVLSARLVASPSLGVKDMWHLVKDYRQTRRLKKAAKSSTKTDEGEADDAASVHSVATEKLEENNEHTTDDIREEEDLRRLGLFILSEVADLLERVKNIFLWRSPSASIFYGAMFFGWFFLGLLPAKPLVRFVGFLAGGFFWHVIPILAAIPPSERSRIPPPLHKVPTDAEYAMDLISQRVARGLPVRPKQRKHGRHSSDGSVREASHAGHGHEDSASSSVDWNKWGDRLATTKELAGGVKQVLRDGQWKQKENWTTALNPLIPKVVAPQGGPEARIETHTFPAQLKRHPGLITLTPTTVIFTPLLSPRAALSIPLGDVIGVKKSGITKGIDIRYSDTRADGSREEKVAKFFFVGSRDDLFARLVSWGGKRWINV